MSQTQIPDLGTHQPDHAPTGHDGVGRQPSATGFWGSMPRVLTALAGLVTALGTAAAVYFGGIKGNGPDNNASSNPVTPPAPVVIWGQPPAPAPTAGVTAGGGDARTRDAFSGNPSGSVESDARSIIAEWWSTLDASTSAVANGCANGYAGDCADMIELLASECEAGNPLSCDVLYLASPEGSALEEYGNSCGGRISDNDAWCRDLARS
ncbi:MAG TPA: hypothetical protein VHF24_09860 [Acidimicrobiales bacterium]|nr:hypothetical protein [Acidimicrobiales bacterium]